MKSSVKRTAIRLDTKLADDAVKVLGVGSRSEAVHTALRAQAFRVASHI
ncbi:MAG: type II toxin-antitoxin system VapB family antitoxin [Nitrospirota bacterium]|nr:type II toxin-antitoxin system VapB family antitoxin [Nitrospirota bacterium]